MSTWPSQLITVQMNQTPKQREVWAMIIGPFGVHPSVDESGWSVTHLRTGVRVAARKDRRDLNERQAIELAARLAAARVSWDFDTLEQMPAATRRRAKRILRGLLTEVATC